MSLNTPIPHVNSTRSQQPLQVVVIGCGKRGSKYIRTLHQLSNVRLAAIADNDRQQLGNLAARYALPSFESMDALLQAVDFDVAVVSVPHFQHYEVTRTLLENGKHVIKEKPLAMSSEEASNLIDLARAQSVRLFTVVQRNYRAPYVFLKEMLPLIGEPYSFIYRYHKNFAAQTAGWRSSRALSGGGVTLDMGYHVTDIIIRLFGMPTSCSSQFGYCFPGTLGERLEDSANILLGYQPRNLNGILSLARHHYYETEELEILGDEGGIYLTPPGFRIYNFSNQLIDEWHQWDSVDETQQMLNHLLGNIDNEAFFEEEAQIHLNNTLLIERIVQASQSPIGSAN